MVPRRFVAALVFALAIAAGGMALSAEAASPPATRIVVYSPFSVTGELSTGISVMKTVTGDCWTASSTSARSDAWRCMSGNLIYDPCYTGAPSSSWVGCPRDTLGKHIVKLKLTRALGTNTNQALDTNRAAPSRVTLEGGVMCSYVAGVTGTVAGLRLNYGCSNGAWLLGIPDRHRARWTILYLASLKSAAAHPTAIVTAIF